MSSRGYSDSDDEKSGTMRPVLWFMGFVSLAVGATLILVGVNMAMQDNKEETAFEPDEPTSGPDESETSAVRVENKRGLPDIVGRVDTTRSRTVTRSDAPTPPTLDAQNQAAIPGSTLWTTCYHSHMHTCGESCCCKSGYAFNPRDKECQEAPHYPWYIKTFTPDKIAENMLWTDCSGKTATGAMMPAEFGGLWWMDGNPAPETVASFGHAIWTSGEEACKSVKLQQYSSEEQNNMIIRSPFGDEVPCRGRMLVAFSADRIWSMPNTQIGRDYEKVGTFANSNMEFVCGGPSPDNLTVCKVGASTGPEQEAFMGRLADSIKGVGAQAFNFLANFAMIKVNANYWIRYSLHDGSYPYHLKRIVGCDGKPVPTHWEQFLSNGKAKPYVQKDVYGHGGDTRATVAPVTQEQFIRWNTAPAPFGSGWVCTQDTGGTCTVFGCKSSRNAQCVNRMCQCKPGMCQENGACTKHESQCFADTGGSCQYFGCAWSRNAECIKGKCMCTGNTCSSFGKCVAPSLSR